MTDHDKLRELAQAADDLAPGDWSHVTEFLKDDIWEKMGAEFIAAANPTAVLALLDEIEQLKTQTPKEYIGWQPTPWGARPVVVRLGRDTEEA